LAGPHEAARSDKLWASPVPIAEGVETMISTTIVAAPRLSAVDRRELRD